MVCMDEHEAEVVIEHSIQVLSSFFTFYRNIGTMFGLSVGEELYHFYLQLS